MKKRKQIQKAFTLIEILVVIALISIIALSSTQINFKRLSEKQEVSIFSNTIISNVETIRDYASTGKGVGANLETPAYWEMRFSQTGSGVIQTYYSTGSLVPFPETNWASNTKETIRNIYCERTNGSTGALLGTGVLVFNGGDITLSGCGDAYYKKLILILGVVNFTETVEINALNGVIQKR